MKIVENFKKFLNIANVFFKNKKFFRILTSSIRILPKFIIIGAQKGGTTSLYNYLIEHPQIEPAFKKEVHFFDVNFKKSIMWYRSFFPSLLYKNYKKLTSKKEIISGEASPYYIIHPHAPKRIFSVIPKVKLIILLRNPVDRAYSHHSHQTQLGFEKLTFRNAIEKEEERLNGEEEKMLKEEKYESYNFGHFTYFKRGIYIDQLKKWFKYFPKEQILIIKSEIFFENPAKIVKQVFKFLELPNWSDIKYIKYAEGSYKRMDKDTRENLIRYFKLHNQRLYKFLGKDFEWDN